MAEMTLRAPTKGEIDEMVLSRSLTLEKLHARVLQADDWMHADEHPSPVIKYINYGFPDSFKFEIYPYGYVVTNRGVNSVHTSEPPQIVAEYAPWAKARYKIKDEDERAVQNALQGLSTSIIVNSTENPLLDFLIQQIGKGMGTLSYKRDYSIFEEAPTEDRGTPESDRAWDMHNEKLATRVPWMVESLHPNHVLFDTDNPTPQDFIIKRPISRASAARQYPVLAKKWGWGTPQEESSSTMTTYLEYCSPRFYACYIDDTPVTRDADDDGVAINHLGHTWYKMALSGFGDKDESGKWERRAVGNIQRGMHLFESLTFNKNWLKLIKQSYVPKIIGEPAQSGVTTADMAKELEGLDMTIPQVVPLALTRLRSLDVPNLPNALLTEIDNTQKEIENLYGPGVLSGQGTSGDEPASKYAARQESARSPYRPAEQAAQQAWSQMLADMLMDIKYEPEFEEGYGVSYDVKEDGKVLQKFAYLRRDQIYPGLRITVDLSPMTPQDRAFIAENAKQMQDNGWWSNERAMKKGGDVEDTLEMQAQIVADFYMKSPEYMTRFDSWIGPKLDEAMGLPPPMMAPPAMPPEPPEQQLGPAPAMPMLPAGVPQAPVPTPGTVPAAIPEAAGLYQSPNLIPAGGGF